LSVEGGEPVFGVIEDGHLGGGVREFEAMVSAEILFELSEREGRIDSEESAGGIDGFENDIAATGATHPVTEDFKESAGFFAIARGDDNFAFFGGHLLQFAGLGNIASEEAEILRLLQSFVARGFVTIGDDVAGESGQEVFRSEIGREGGHAGEGWEGAGNGDHGIAGVFTGGGR